MTIMDSVGLNPRFGYATRAKGQQTNFQRNCYALPKDEADSFDKSNNGKFDISEAGKNFLKGIVSPITAVIKHPIATVGVIAGTVAACSLVPVLGPLLAVGFGALSLVQLGKGCADVIKNCRKGNYDNAEKSFNKVGEGVIGTVLSALGVKQGARVAQEAKLMSESKLMVLSEAQRAEIAANVKKAGFITNLKENLSLITTKTGFRAVANQFKPSMLKARFNEIKGFFDKSKWVKEKEQVVGKKLKGTQEQIAEFKKTPEGIRRANLTDEQIKAEVDALYNEAFDRLGVPKEQRPKLELEPNINNPKHGGSYNSAKHRIEVNPEAYKSGIMEIEDVVMHESTHCKEALLRAGIPKDRAEIIVKEELLNRIINGEAEKIIKRGGFLGPDMMEPPKMSPRMSQDFAQFAKDNLYQNDSKLLTDLYNYDLCKDGKNYAEFAKAKTAVEPLLDKLKVLLDKNPEFVRQYGSEEKALNVLVEYSLSQTTRFRSFSNTQINGLNIEPLSGDALKYAEQSLVDNIATIEGNGRISGFRSILMSDADFNQYQFSPEEVLAQKNGNSFLIEKMTAKMAQMRKAGTLSVEDEAYMTKAIEKAKLVIEYKTKGLEYYKQYTQLIHNPEDAMLKESVAKMAKELKALEKQITPEEWENITRMIKVFGVPEHTTTDIPINMIYQIINSMKNNRTLV